MRPAKSVARALAAAVALAAAPAAAAPAVRGHLIVIGGGARHPDVVKAFLELAGGPRARIVVFPMASSAPDESGQEHAGELKAAGAQDVRVVGLTREQADGEEGVAVLAGASGVLFGGGDQSRLMAVLGGTRTQARLRELYRNGGVVAGTSAGAAVMSRVMITGDERRPQDPEAPFQSIESENVVTAPGLGLLEEHAVIDQHFVRRRRHNRLLSVVLESRPLLGIGIDEETAVVVKPDRSFEVLGGGVVVVYDTKGTTVRRDPQGHGLRAADLKVHVLRAGSVFDLAGRKVRRLGP
jgi:cyanophycinase